MNSPTIPEVEPQFEKEINQFQQQVIRYETPTLQARRRSSIFQETLTPDPSVCRWLLDIISEDEHMVNESAHFVLSENQFARDVAYTFDVHESQIQLNIEDEGCCGRFCSDSTQALNEILIGNVNILKRDVEKLIEAYSKTEENELLALKLNISDQIDAYNKTEVDALLDDKLNIPDQIDAYSKTEVDALLDDKLNITDQIDAYSKQEDDALLLLKTDKSELIDAYNKSEIDALLDNKLNITDQIDADKIELIDAYNKTEVDALLDEKLNIIDQIDAYNKYEVDALLDDKFNITDQIDAYSIQEDDALLLLKADKTELADYVDLASTQTITGQKQFGIISVSSISIKNKNDASILLAGGSDMLVSSLVSQPQLQEVRDIASGKSKGYVFATTDEMNTWMEDLENVAQLTIGDNLYIFDKQVMDYWWDGSNLRAIETELPDMSNVMTILGTPTGGGNAIIDLSFDGNIQIPAKNSSFITTNNDETITGQKTFYTTIHSVGISVQNYNNNSVVCAGGADALLDDKLNVSDYIDAYTKGETNNLLNNKANSGVSYTKGEDDALLLLKADKTQLIDAYTKVEDDALLLLKADKTQLIEAYTKGEDDALLLLKADKTQLIDAYTKGEINNLLKNKADSGVSYTKGEDDALLLLKANQSSTYTKIETDQFISQIEVGDVVLSGFMTLGTSQTKTANKSFNYACRFVSFTDGMATITGTQFVKSGADDTVVLLGAETDNKYVRLDGSIQQTITGRLKYVSPFDQTYDETQDPVANTYLTMLEVDSKLTNYVNTTNNQEINGTKTFNSNVNAAGFAKTCKNDTLILLAGGGDRLLSSFGGIEDLSSSTFSGMNGAVIQYKLIRIGNLYIFSLLACGGNYNMGTINTDYLVQDDIALVTYIPFPNHTIDKDGYVSITHSTGLITCKSTTNTYIQCTSATWFE
ncbi:MAG: hypothetical protein EZS28_016419 [Streblomastix strix]|uniref:Uncharacterized protein n=1 Tax=Streblomastix strix TaxID=222440 RepID=A0A5J4VZQ3_9EUKA|nr:MAG: hypothetical protein EZS28_016419 [Streblomastix strix]